MDELPFYTHIFSLGAGIEACLEKQLMMPALILIYSGIDILGWLASSDEFATKQSFLNWADNYILKTTPLNCKALDLYGARCSLLHTLTGKAKPMPGEQPRQICYAYLRDDVDKIQRTINLGKNGDKFVAIQLNALWEAWRLAVMKFIEELGENPDRKSRVISKADKFYSNLDPALIDKAIANLGLMEQLGIPVEKVPTFGKKSVI